MWNVSLSYDTHITLSDQILKNFHTNPKPKKKKKTLNLKTLSLQFSFSPIRSQILLPIQLDHIYIERESDIDRYDFVVIYTYFVVNLGFGGGNGEHKGGE